MTDMAAMLNAYPGTLPKIDDDALVICVQDYIATAVVRVLSRPTPYDGEVTAATLRALIEACRAAYDECRKHALDNEACRICGEACRRCAHACRHLLRPLERA